MKKVFLLFLCFICALLMIGVYFSKPAQAFEFGNPIWIHHAGHPQNSIEGFQSSLDQGFNGIELDVFFHNESGKFIVSHDWPVQGEVIELQFFLKRFSANKDLRLWLDLKNANLFNLFSMKERLTLLMQSHQMNGRIFIESTHNMHQLLLSWSGIPVSLWVQNHKKSRLPWLRRYQDLLTLRLGSFVAASMPWDSYEDLQSPLQNFNKLVFTVNDKSQQAELLKDPSVKIILQDLELPRNRVD